MHKATLGDLTDGAAKRYASAHAHGPNSAGIRNRESASQDLVGRATVFDTVSRLKVHGNEVRDISPLPDALPPSRSKRRTHFVSLLQDQGP